MPAQPVAADRGVAHGAAGRAGQPEPHPPDLRQPHLRPLAVAPADRDGLTRKRYRQACRPFPERRGAGGVLRVPPVIVGAVELAEHLLGRLCGQVGKPGKVAAGPGELGALLHRPQGVAAVAVEVLPLLQCQVPDRPAGVAPSGQTPGLLWGRVGAIAAASVRLGTVGLLHVGSACLGSALGSTGCPRTSQAAQHRQAYPMGVTTAPTPRDTPPA
jgi:hypothetical protein